jgi:uncharacterized protein involved in exopolysaccharide biosynthesis
MAVSEMPLEEVDESAGLRLANHPLSSEVYAILSKGRLRIALVTLGALIAGGILLFFLKPNFVATAIIMPPQQQPTSAAALMSQIGSLGSLGGASGLGIKTAADMYVGMLQSQTISDAIIRQFDLKIVYKTKKLVDARRALKSHTEFENGKDGLIHIAATDHDPKRASEIANAYVRELYNMNSHLVVTEASQRATFFDQQLNLERAALNAAEDAMKNTQEKTGFVEFGGQADITLRNIASMQAEIASREVELQSMRTFATEQNPDVTRIQEEISTMRGQLARMENDRNRPATPGNVSIPASQVATDALENSRTMREVRFHENLLDLLSKQYEAAKIDEAKSAPIIEVIDYATPPDKKDSPHGSLIMAISGLLGACAGCVWQLMVSDQRERG